MTTVTAVTCPKCGYTVYSRTQHDFRKCFCGAIFIDGGFEYTRVGFSTDMEPPKVEQRDIPQSLDELYNDWNERKNIFGIIEPDFGEKKEN